MDTINRAPTSTTRSRMVGGVLLLIGVMALIGFFAIGSQCSAVIAGAGLFIGGMVFIMDGSGGSPGLMPPH